MVLDSGGSKESSLQIRSGAASSLHLSPPTHQFGFPVAPITSQGSAFHNDLLSICSARAALPCPPQAHNSIAKHHCLPEPIPGSSQVSCPPGCPLATVSYTYHVPICLPKPDSEHLEDRRAPSYHSCWASSSG